MLLVLLGLDKATRFHPVERRRPTRYPAPLVRLVTVIGGGLAGVEAARVLSRLGVPVRLHEMRPRKGTAAHKTGDLAEIVCSNSLGSLEVTAGSGLLLAEMERLGSVVVAAAKANAVPAGSSLAVDRVGFGRDVTAFVEALPGVELVREEVPALPDDGPVVVCTGPLTSESLHASIRALTGDGGLYFYDAIAPIVAADSIDREKVYAASRWGKGTPDFLNCPMTREQYHAFVDALLSGEKVPPKDFEREVFFEGCMPVEEMARRGRETLAFGPMRPVGLADPRTGKRPYAVVQLRREDRHGQLYNLVGFQTKLRYPEQKRIFSTIPGLEHAEFVRLGSIHRNTFLNAPKLLAPDLSLRAGRPETWFAGQMIGVEGYAESAALGMMAGLAVADRLASRPFVAPPRTTAIGGLMAYLREADPAHFQPMNVNAGLLPPLDLPRPKREDKRERKRALAVRALRDQEAWIASRGLGALAAARQGRQPATRG